jgi:hypothetical protein
VRIIVSEPKRYRSEDFRLLDEAVRLLPEPVSGLITGRVRGSPTVAEVWARERSVPVLTYPADWQAHGKRAGVFRNALMVRDADALVVLWNRLSTANRDLAGQAMRRNLLIIDFVMEAGHGRRRTERHYGRGADSADQRFVACASVSSGVREVDVPQLR